MRSSGITSDLQVSQESNRLKRLTQTLRCGRGVNWVSGIASVSSDAMTYHLVGQDSVDTVMVQRSHPVETGDLIITHLSSLDDCRTTPEISKTNHLPEIPELTCWTFVVDINPLILFVIVVQQLFILLLFGFPMSSPAIITIDNRSDLQLRSRSVRARLRADSRFLLLLALGILLRLLVLDHFSELGITFFLPNLETQGSSTPHITQSKTPRRSPHLDLQEMLE